jgi:hypothetical protein
MSAPCARIVALSLHPTAALVTASRECMVTRHSLKAAHAAGIHISTESMHRRATLTFNICMGRERLRNQEVLAEEHCNQKLEKKKSSSGRELKKQGNMSGLFWNGYVVCIDV